MAGTICQGLIKSDFIDGSEVYGYDINSQQLMMFEQDFGIHICSSEQDVVKNCDYLVMGVKPNVVESVISKIKSVIDQQVIVSIVAGYGNDKYEELLPGTHHLTIMPNTPAKVLEGTTLFEKDNTLTAEELNYVQTMFESIGEVYLIENYQMVAGGALSGCGPAFVYIDYDPSASSVNQTNRLKLMLTTTFENIREPVDPKEKPTLPFLNGVRLNEAIKE